MFNYIVDMELFKVPQKNFGAKFMEALHIKKKHWKTKHK